MKSKKTNCNSKNISLPRHGCEATPGYIYILSNPSFGNLYKIGMTTKDPYVRAEELSSLTAVPSPFKVEYYVYVNNCSFMETMTHRVLEVRGYRFNENREFFNAPIKEIKKVIRKFNRKPIYIKAEKFIVQIFSKRFL